MLVTRNAETAIAQFAYCCAMYKNALRTLDRKFCPAQVVVSAYLDELNCFPPLEMHNSDNIISYPSCTKVLSEYLIHSHMILV